ncbi:transient receptor potential cation channel protein painless-like [Lasioglossum baleicum]|uniref:transient receptor potential cation channel protein painless-like n=1 Tax=Lasioglossum baleicum TaxID=434251 RepID=UPI003FCED024
MTVHTTNPIEDEHPDAPLVGCNEAPVDPNSGETSLPPSDANMETVTFTDDQLLDMLEYLEQNNMQYLLIQFSELIQKKWNEERLGLILNIILYSIAWVSLNGYILAVKLDWQHILVPWILAGIGLAFLLVREIFQFVASPCCYLLTFRNGPKFALVLLGLWVVCDRKVNSMSPIVIVLSAWEMVLTICLCPRLFVIITYIKGVIRVILKASIVYGMLVCAFGFAYFISSNEDADKSFAALDQSIINTTVMLMGEGINAVTSFENNWLIGRLVSFLFLVVFVSFNPVIGLLTNNIEQSYEAREFTKLISRIRWIRYVQNIRVAAGKVFNQISHWRNQLVG